MPEKCPYCGNEFANSKALGSHIHYMHSNTCAINRTGADQQRFERIVTSCLSETGLPKPRRLDKIEQAICEIAEGVSPTLDKYRDVFKCATAKEKLLKEVEEDLLPELRSNDANRTTKEGIRQKP